MAATTSVAGYPAFSNALALRNIAIDAAIVTTASTRNTMLPP